MQVDNEYQPGDHYEQVRGQHMDQEQLMAMHEQYEDEDEGEGEEYEGEGDENEPNIGNEMHE